MPGKLRENPYKVKIRTGFTLRRPKARANPVVGKVRASKPIPDPTVHFIGGQPMRGPDPGNLDPSKTATTRLIGAEALGYTDAFVGTLRRGLDADPTTDPGDPIWWEHDRAQKKLEAQAVNAQELNRYGTEDVPTRERLEQVRRMVVDIVRDTTYSPEERVAIAQAYREYADRFLNGDESERLINNWHVETEYRRLYAQEREKRNEDRDRADPNFLEDMLNGPDGDFLSQYEGPLGGEVSDFFGPGFIISMDERGWYTIEQQADLWQQISSAARSDPETAAELITKLAAWGAYGGAAEKYAPNNVVYGADGTPIAGRWTKDDDQALQEFLGDIALQQGGGDYAAWQEILDERAAVNSEVLGGALGEPGVGDGGGGGGGGYRGYGGYGGGGYGGGGSAGVSYTDANELKQLVNSIARARLGMVLTDAQVQEFVTHYHQQEAAFVNARMAGQSAMQLDPESQAAAWIESRFRDAMAAQSGNSFITAMAGWLLGGGTIGSGT